MVLRRYAPRLTKPLQHLAAAAAHAIQNSRKNRGPVAALPVYHDWDNQEVPVCALADSPGNLRELHWSRLSRGRLSPCPHRSLLAQWQKGQSQAAKLTPTPTSTEVLGPFYKKGAPNLSTLRAPGDPGFPLRVSEKVLDTRGEPVPGARIDIWQADHAGHYDVQGYRYRTKLVVEASAEYSIDTVMPGHYSDRPAQHIHYMITGATTQTADHAGLLRHRSLLRGQSGQELQQALHLRESRPGSSRHVV